MLSLSTALLPPALSPDESLRARQRQAQMPAGAYTPDGQPHNVKTASAEVASLLVFQMLQAMRRTVPKSGLLDKGFAHETYVSLFDQELARHIAQRQDLGLTALLERQLRTSDTDRQAPGRPAVALPCPPAGHSTSCILPPAQKDTVLDAYRQHTAPTDSLFIRPVEGRRTSAFGWREHPIDHDEQWHNGIDIAAPVGTPVRAAAAGQVLFSGTQSGYGNVVIIQHAEGYTTLYAHNAANLVSVGTAVQQGQPIATVGSTGRTTGPHLHFEVRKDGQRLDPAPFLEAGSARALKFLMASADTKAIP